MTGSVTSMLPELRRRENIDVLYAKALDRDTYPFLLFSPSYSSKPAVLQHYMIKIADTMCFNI